MRRLRRLKIHRDLGSLRSVPLPALVCCACAASRPLRLRARRFLARCARSPSRRSSAAPSRPRAAPPSRSLSSSLRSVRTPGPSRRSSAAPSRPRAAPPSRSLSSSLRSVPTPGPHPGARLLRLRGRGPLRLRARFLARCDRSLPPVPTPALVCCACAVSRPLRLRARFLARCARTPRLAPTKRSSATSARPRAAPPSRSL